MNDELLEALLIYCLDELEAGVPAAEILARYPEQATQIQPLLQMTTQLALLAPEPAPTAQVTSQTVFLAQAQAMKKTNRRSGMAVGGRRRLASALGFLLIFFVGLLAASAETASALPGSAFYPVKRASEELRLNLSRDSQVRERLYRQFAAERVQEINALLAIDREAVVDCYGRIEAMGVDVWTIYGLSVVVDEQTAIEGSPFVGAEVFVQGVTRDGRFIATQIIVQPGQDAPPILTATLTPAATALPVATDTVVPTFTPTPAPTATPQPLPDPEPEYDDDDDDDDDEDEDDNSGHGSRDGDEDDDEDENDEDDEDDEDDDEDENDEDDEDDNSGHGSRDGDEDNEDDDEDE